MKIFSNGYTECDYIQTNGTQIFLNPLFEFAKETLEEGATGETKHLIIDMELTDSASDQTIVSTDGGSDGNITLQLLYVASSSKFVLVHQSGQIEIPVTDPKARLQIKIFYRYTDTEVTLYVIFNDTEYTAKSNISENDEHITIGNSASMKIYSVRISYISEESDVYRFEPAIQISDSTAGFFESATMGVFFLSQSGENFEAGYFDIPGYTRYDYIQTSGTQVLNTGVNWPSLESAEVNTSNYLRVDMQMTDTTSDQTIVDSSGGKINAQLLYVTSSNRYAIAQSQDSTQNSTIMEESIPKQRSQVDIYHCFNSSTSTYTMEGVFLYKYYSLTENSSETGTITVGNSANMKIYGVKWFDNNNLCLLNFIPAVRDSDSAVGFYETINGVFYVNSGTGDFIAGNDTKAFSVLKSSLLKVAHAIKNKVYQSNGMGTPEFWPDESLLNFPDGFYSAIDGLSVGSGSSSIGRGVSDRGPYEEYQYLQIDTPGAVWDTGIIPTSDCQITFQFNDLSSSVEKTILGTADGDNYCSLKYADGTYTIGLSGTTGSGGTWSAGPKTLLLNQLVSSMDTDGNVTETKTAMLDGVILDNATASSTTNLLIGQIGTNKNMGSIIIHSLIVNSNGETVLDLVPAGSWTDDGFKIGFFDMVSNTFIENTGSGSVIAGPSPVTSSESSGGSSGGSKY